MFERIYSWSMRNGSRILFIAAILVLLIGMLTLAWEFRGSNNITGSPSAYMAVSMFLGQLVPSAFLFLGAVLADRLTRN